MLLSFEFSLDINLKEIARARFDSLGKTMGLGGVYANKAYILNSVAGLVVFTG